ncbi:uncharacterized protein C21orf58 isoform X2 [Hypanus sabinus]|uniref:uncharacterized protein C21orf58 isoform X2 n=1 Tax=Hypanus sabinus TaxID=79690 RepID=UPI0028C4DF4D|nr:uncharacterized protein C21orf58 isoform X2 [Hypanus sabinus]XP_059823390.1 uncharacterized protein C21orf58 isoform X2 [Hypanus sabinus]XP_059823391.1 uncharacterized protein C21orf58 isoform X2 [Hypanus sabinus]
MRMETADPSLVDQMTRLKLKLLEKKLENEREILDGHSDTAESTARSFDGQGDALHNALKRKKGLLQKLREQHMLDESSRPHTWGGTRRRYPRLEPIQQAPPIHVYHQPPPEQPRIIQHPYPQQPATIIQQLPQQQPLITQIPPPQALPPIRSGSIKEGYSLSCATYSESREASSIFSAPSSSLLFPRATHSTSTSSPTYRTPTVDINATFPPCGTSQQPATFGPTHDGSHSDTSYLTNGVSGWEFLPDASWVISAE